MKRTALGACLSLLLVFVGLAHAEVIQRGSFRIAVGAKITPKRLPRSKPAPVQFALHLHLSAKRGSEPPQLRDVTLEINRHGHFDPGAVPVCQMNEIQPATTANALAACGGDEVGTGRLLSKVKFTQGAPFPSDGKLIAFNGRWQGRPAILAHVYGTKPLPTSVTIPFVITQTHDGQFGTSLEASLSTFSGKWGHVTSLSMSLGGAGATQDRSHYYLSAGCPAPKGFGLVGFPLSRARFGFVGRPDVVTSLSGRLRAATHALKRQHPLR